MVSHQVRHGLHIESIPSPSSYRTPYHVLLFHVLLFLFLSLIYDVCVFGGWVCAWVYDVRWFHSINTLIPPVM